MSKPDKHVLYLSQDIAWCPRWVREYDAAEYQRLVAKASMKVAKRERKYRMLQVPFDQADARWKCETCDAPTENDESRWCIHCRMYWEDCRNGHD